MLLYIIIIMKRNKNSKKMYFVLYCHLFISTANDEGMVRNSTYKSESSEKFS